MDLINGFVIASNKKKYVLNFLNIVDLVTLVPIFMEYIQENKVANLSFTRIWRFVRFLRFFRIYKIFWIVTRSSKTKVPQMLHPGLKKILISNSDPIDVKRKLFTIFI